MSSESHITTLNPHLAGLLDMAEAVVPHTLEIVQRLNNNQLLWRPAPRAWGIAHCFDHLIVTGNAYYPRVRKAIDEARRLGTAPSRHPFRKSRFGRWFIHSAGPSTRIKIRAHRIFQPSATPSPRSFAEFIVQQEILLRLIVDADGADLNGVTITSPLSRLLSLSLGECLEMLVVHQQRHLAQAQRVLDAPGFPRS